MANKYMKKFSTSLTHYQRNANQNHITPSHTSTISHQSEWLLPKCLQTINAGEGAEKREPSYTVDGNANLYNHYRKQYGDSLKN